MAVRSGALAGARKSERDPRIDVLRGLALIMIFIDHVPENLYSFYTIRMIGFSDAAEAFVLISGISAGLAYSHRFVPGQMWAAALRVWKRGLTIYGAHLLSTILALAITIPVVVYFGMIEFAENNGIDWVWEKPLATAIGLFTLSYQVSYFNILPLYVALFAAVPLLLWIGRQSLGMMLGFAVVIWLVSRGLDTNMPAYPGDWAWYFDPFCWLLLFAIGLAIGTARRQGWSLVPFSSKLYALCVGFVVFAAVWRFTGHYAFPFPSITPAIIADTSKETLGLPRIAHILALAYIVIYLPGLRSLLGARVFSPFNIMGRASLVTFVTGSLIAFSLQLFRLIVSTTLLEDTLLLLTGIVIQYAVARYALARAGRLRQKQAKPSPPSGIDRPAPKALALSKRGG
ncbi:OpgC family protein [Martelella endophytica]|uniref:OpgC family protein n=1 Tax=Martelella endophytica TaxID=1486262 RepID=UPI001FCD8D02|nr:OpgC domain-containing protein [Martelella endophytica]